MGRDRQCELFARNGPESPSDPLATPPCAMSTIPDSNHHRNVPAVGSCERAKFRPILDLRAAGAPTFANCPTRDGRATGAEEFQAANSAEDANRAGSRPAREGRRPSRAISLVAPISHGARKDRDCAVFPPRSWGFSWSVGGRFLRTGARRSHRFRDSRRSPF